MDLKDYFEEGMRQLNDRNYYQKLDKNPTVDHEKLVNNTIDDLVSENAIDEDTASLLCPSKSRTPKFYMLPKIHKEGMPGRPVVSSVSSPTEKIFAFVDEFLKPMAQELPSYIKDTTHFLQKVDKVGEISEDTYMVTLDVKSLYTNIDNEEGLRVFEEELKKRSAKNTPSFAIALLMKLVLILNNLVFNGVNYLQKMGVAMGTRSAPNFSNVFMGYFEKRFVYNSKWFKRFIKSWWRYIDDIFMLWKGPKNHLEDCLSYLNEVHPSIKFEWKISKKQVSFLDFDVIRYNNRLKTAVHQKPTECHPYLDYTSAHPSHFKSSIPYSQALRLRRICKDNNVLKERIKQYTNYFVACEYKRSFVKKEMERVLEVRRKDTLVKKEKNKDNRIPPVVTYHPDLPPVGQIINKHWPMLHHKDFQEEDFQEDFQEQTNSLLQKTTESQGYAGQIYIQLPRKPLE